MNIVFLTIGPMDSIEKRSMYPDILRSFRDNGHNVYIVSPREKRTGLPTELKEDHGAHMLYVSIGNITKCGMIEKGISTLSIEKCYLKAIKKYFPDVRFDLVLYSTPPITLVGVVEYIKKRDNAKSYLMLKDIFPQNAVDIGIMKKTGVYGLLYRYFRKKEKKLYKASDIIGCMSPANVDYVLTHNPEIVKEKVEVCPNCTDPAAFFISDEQRKAMREKYGIPTDKKVFVYGGNLGKPQGIPLFIECLRTRREDPDSYFLIVGDGTEYSRLEKFIAEEKQPNVKLLKRLPKEDYDMVAASCDVGIIFLDHRFTIPNFPSRLLSCLRSGIPVLACTDPNTDIGRIAQDAGFGWWCESNDPKGFSALVDKALESDLKSIGEIGYRYLCENYTVEKSYNIIMKHFNK